MSYSRCWWLVGFIIDAHESEVRFLGLVFVNRGTLVRRWLLAQADIWNVVYARD
jgi:hypothetical protein